MRSLLFALPALLTFALCACETKEDNVSEGNEAKPSAEEEKDEATAARPAPKKKPWEGEALPLPEGNTVWRGTIGPASVVFELRRVGDAVGGRYYYAKHGRSLILTGHSSGGKLELQEQGGKKDEIFGEKLSNLSLTHKRGWLIGNWKGLSPAAKWVNIKLEEQAKADYDEFQGRPLAPEPAAGGKYQITSSKSLVEHLVYCKTKEKPPLDLSLIPGLEVIEEDCHFAFEGKLGKRIVIDVESMGITEASDGIDETQTNRALATTIEYEAGETWEGSMATKVLFAGPRFLSVERSSSGLGLGAYPDHNSSPLTIRLKDGAQLKLEDLLKTGEPEFRADLLKFAAKLESSKKGCNWKNTWSEDGEYVPLGAHLSGEGIHLTPYFSHADKACQYGAFGTLLSKKLTKKYATDLAKQLLSED